MAFSLIFRLLNLKVAPETILFAVGYGVSSQFGMDTALWLIVLTHIIMMLGIGMVLASVQTKTLFSETVQTLQQVAGAVGIAVIVSILSAKQSSLLATFSIEPTQAVATGFTLNVASDR